MACTLSPKDRKPNFIIFFTDDQDHLQRIAMKAINNRNTIRQENAAKKVSIAVLKGTLNLTSFTLEDFGDIDFYKGKTFDDSDTVTFYIEKD